ncbi:carboxypeptidase Y [Phlyctema vagabunda]|uniref:carboxypeptidase C n=1 Tax=Phlyctema vagabunda TaxID=108571 RepID=A0ABR4P5H6_9HELO
MKEFSIATGLITNLFITPILGSQLFFPAARQQIPLNLVDLTTKQNQHQKHRVASDGDGFWVKEQGEDICSAGTKQWTGSIDVSEEKSLFFWFFESRNDAKNDPLVVWLNGGPGGSSMFGLFREIGPCLVNEYGNGTKFNPYSWSNHANMLFIDQPASVGFSTVNGTSEGGPTTLLESAIDFEKFLVRFFGEVFPQFAKHSFHITGESFAGHYIPYFTSYIGERQRTQAKDYLTVPIQSMVLVDAVTNMVTSTTGGLYDHFCTRDEHGILNKPNGFNETTCAAMAKALPACEALADKCVESYDGNLCYYAATFCDQTVGKWFMEEVYVGGRDPYDDRKICQQDPPMCEDFANGTIGIYLNRPHVLQGIGMPDDFYYAGVNLELGERWCSGTDCSIPTTREVQYVLENMDARVLVINGNNDSLVNTAGNIRAWEQTAWSKQALFRVMPFVNWFYPSESKSQSIEAGMTKVKGGQVKSAGKLSFVTIDEAGHASPGDQPEAVAWIIDCWFNGHSSKEGGCPI